VARGCRIATRALPDISKYRELHESFVQPEDGSVKVWRYLDLARFVWGLSANRLPFIRSDLFADRFEGSLTRPTQKIWGDDPVLGSRWSELRPDFKREVYLSCWPAGNAESEAMWKLYCGAAGGVAMETTYEKLDASLPDGAFLGAVSYVDYEMDEMATAGNMLSPFMHKRPAFQYEHEVRAVLWPFNMKGTITEPVADLALDRFPSPVALPAVSIPWKAEEVLDAVHISPYAEEWYRDAVAAVVDRFAPALAGRLR
jgi:hypothetical protein